MNALDETAAKTKKKKSINLKKIKSPILKSTKVLDSEGAVKRE